MLEQLLAKALPVYSLFFFKEVNILNLTFLCFISGLQYKLPDGGCWEVNILSYSGSKWSASVLNCFGVVDEDMEQYNDT